MKLGIVVILYHPQATQLKNMLALDMLEALPIVLVDNSPVPLSITFPKNVHYLHYPSNVGIASAQNRGIEMLIENSCELALIFDQDSDITGELVNGLKKEFQSATEHFSKVAAVGPKIICEFNDAPVEPRLQKPLEVRGGLADVRQIIASGMLLSIEAFHNVGGKEELLFIDGVDHEWCWRARTNGFHILQSQNVKMRHRQGDARQRILGLNFKRGAPVRLYYQVRNVLILCRRSYVPTYWKVRHLTALPLRWLVNRWHFPDGKQRGSYMFKGLVDGMLNRNGKLD